MSLTFRLNVLCAVISSFCLANTTLADSELNFGKVPSQSPEFYKTRYGLGDIYAKLVDNRGNGFEPLYGVRNMRVVLNGILYRGGANNVFNVHQKRPNDNPLPNEGLDHLCEEGFSTSVYLYEKNYETAPKLTRCTSVFKVSNELDYRQLSPLSSEVDARAVLKIIYDRLMSNSDQSPIYLHCWNGWHASGFISALSLRQFCGLNESQAVSYWDRNTDGYNTEPKYESIRRKIRNFKPFQEFQISAELKRKICLAP